MIDYSFLLARERSKLSLLMLLLLMLEEMEVDVLKSGNIGVTLKYTKVRRMYLTHISLTELRISVLELLEKNYKR